jgi:hypothetical protein
VSYADGCASNRHDPAVDNERFMARSSLGSCLRKARRPRDAIRVAQSTIEMQRTNPVGWTVLTGATRDLHGGSAAGRVVEDGLVAVGVGAAGTDPMFASAAAAAYRDAGLVEFADLWQAAAASGDERELPSRSDTLDRAAEFARILRKRGQMDDAELFEAIVRCARRPLRGDLATITSPGARVTAAADADEQLSA